MIGRIFVYLFVLFCFAFCANGQRYNANYTVCGQPCTQASDCGGDCNVCVEYDSFSGEAACALLVSPTIQQSDWQYGGVAKNDPNYPNAWVWNISMPNENNYTITSLEIWINATAVNNCTSGVSEGGLSDDFEAQLLPLTDPLGDVTVNGAAGVVYTNLFQNESLGNAHGYWSWLLFGDDVVQNCRIDFKWRVTQSKFPQGNVNLDGNVNQFTGSGGGLIGLRVGQSNLFNGSQAFAVEVSSEGCRGAVFETWSTIDDTMLPVSAYDTNFTASNPTRMLGDQNVENPSAWMIYVYLTDAGEANQCTLMVNASVAPTLSVGSSRTFFSGNTSYAWLRSGDDEFMIGQDLGFTYVVTAQVTGCMTLQFSGTGSICNVNIDGSTYDGTSYAVTAGQTMRMDFLQAPRLWYCAGWLSIQNC